MGNDYKEYLQPPIRNDRKPLQEILPVNRPLRLLIDPSDICNFRCEFCFQSKSKFKGVKMSRETFDRIIDQMKEFGEPINVVHLYGLGEPLVNNLIPFFVNEVKRNGVGKEVAVTTNGSLLTHKMSEELVAAGLDRLSISLNGLSPDEFKTNVGVSVDFNKLYSEIKYFYSIKGECHLHVKINGEQYSEDKKKRFVEMFRECTDSLNIDHIVNVWPGLNITDNVGDKMYDYYPSELDDSNSAHKTVCPLMFYELLVHSDGSVSPCCVDYEFKKENLGNVFHNSLKEIWFGDRLNEIRIANLKGEKICYEACNKCRYMDCAATVNITPYRRELLRKYERHE